MSGEQAYNRLKKQYDKKLTEIKNLKQKLNKKEIVEKRLEEFEFTSCEDCIHKTEVYSLTCGECRHFYGCLFEKKEEL